MNLLTSPLLTDLYQLTMMQGYVDEGMHEEAVFEFYVRSLPLSRGFLVAAGLETLLAFLEGMRFNQEELEYIAGTGSFLHRCSIIWLNSASAAMCMPCRKEQYFSKTSLLCV